MQTNKYTETKGLLVFSSLVLGMIFLVVFFFVYLFLANTDKQQVKQLETNNKIQIFFVNEHQFELEYVIKKIQHSDNCPKCKETMKNFLYDVLIFDNNQQEINNIVEGYFNNGK